MAEGGATVLKLLRQAGDVDRIPTVEEVVADIVTVPPVLKAVVVLQARADRDDLFGS